MKPQHTIEVVDPEEWRRTYTVHKAIIHVGSDAQNDVALDARRGSGVAPRHLQLITLNGTDTRYRLVNLANTPLALEVDGTERSLEPRSSADVGIGARIYVGEYNLVLRGGEPGSAPRGREQAGEAIGLKLNLPHTTLTPEHPIEGAITVTNLGDETAVQFELDAKGLPSECYQMGPAPILFPGASKEIFFRLRHPQSPALPAGDHRISVHAAAPNSYPGESATVSQTIHVQPHYSHVVRLTPVER